MLAAIFEVNFPQPVGRRRQSFRLAHAAGQQRHGHVFQSRELRQQIMELPDVADLAIAKAAASRSESWATLIEAQCTVPR